MKDVSRDNIVSACKKLIKEIDIWNEEVQEIIGKVPNYKWEALEEARRLVGEAEDKIIKVGVTSKWDFLIFVPTVIFLIIMICAIGFLGH